MDLRDHINVIKNHGYKGWVALYKGPDNLCIKSGTVVLVEAQPEYLLDGDRPSEEVDWLNQHRTMEIPFTEEQIAQEKARGSGLLTWKTTVGTPLSQLEKIGI